MSKPNQPPRLMSNVSNGSLQKQVSSIISAQGGFHQKTRLKQNAIHALQFLSNGGAAE